MTVIVAFCSQKGGVGKSTLARALAAYLAGDGFSVRIADLDAQQTTSAKWMQRRKESDYNDPAVEVVPYPDVASAIEEIDGLDVLIVDGYARSSEGTLLIAQEADLVVQPSNGYQDDCEPAVLVFYDLYNAGIDPSRMVIAMTRLTTPAEEKEGRAYFASAEIPIKVLDGGLYQKRGYGIAQDEGRTVLETGYDKLNESAKELMAALVAEIVAVRQAGSAAA
ncbi:MAG: AAA family ATPase [Pseudomonadota bacterium]